MVVEIAQGNKIKATLYNVSDRRAPFAHVLNRFFQGFYGAHTLKILYNFQKEIKEQRGYYSNVMERVTSDLDEESLKEINNIINSRIEVKGEGFPIEVTVDQLAQSRAGLSIADINELEEAGIIKVK